MRIDVRVLPCYTRPYRDEMDLEPEGIVSKIITCFNLDQKTTERYVSDIFVIRFAVNKGGIMDQNQL